METWEVKEILSKANTYDIRDSKGNHIATFSKEVDAKVVVLAHNALEAMGRRKWSLLWHRTLNHWAIGLPPGMSHSMLKGWPEDGFFGETLIEGLQAVVVAEAWYQSNLG